MSGLMRAMVLKRPGEPLQLESVPVPRPADGELLVRIRACAVCRTDLHVVDGELPHPKLPLIPGHEIVGEVVAVGSGVAAGRVGERVGVPWLGRTCGECWYCQHSQENLCDAPQFTGYTRDGGYAEFVVADARYCFPLPGGPRDAEAAPLLCAGLIGYRSLRMAGEAERLGLYGFGAAAHIVAQVARHQGRKVFAFTRSGDTAAQEFARRQGAVWVGASDELPSELLDAAILFAPVGALVPAALKAVRKGGVVVCGGIHMSDIPSFPYGLLWGERVVRSVANLTRQDGAEFLALATQVPVRTTVTEFPLEQANEVLARLRRGEFEGAAVLVPQSSSVGVEQAEVRAADGGDIAGSLGGDAETHWSIVVYEAYGDPHSLARILVDELGLPPNDALIHARYAPGLLSERLTRAEAERIVARLRQGQFPSDAVDTAKLPDFRHAIASHHVRCAADGLQLHDLRGNVERTVPWEELALIGAGLVPLETARRTDLDDVHFFAAARRSHHAASAARLPPVMEAWLLSADGRLVLRLDQTRMNFESLGDRKSDSASDNFRKLFDDIVSHAGSAHLTPSTNAWRTHASVFRYVFDSSRQLQRATQLQWLRLRARRCSGDE